MEKVTEITLVGLAEGAAGELFDRAFAEVLENIQDPNTEPEVSRKITLELTVSPSEDRERAETSLKVVPKLAPAKPHHSLVYMGRRDGKLVAVRHDPRQRGLFDGGSEDASVTPIDSHKKEA